MTSLLLIRHAQTRSVGRRLSGRTLGVHLDGEGERQANNLAQRLACVPISAVFSSPMERAIETAASIASRHGLHVQLAAGLCEIDFGGWTNRTFEELDELPRWSRYNRIRSCTRIPGGEHFAEVQARVVRALETIRDSNPDGSVAIVSHADVIRAALAYFAAVPIDLFLRLEIDLSSVSVIKITDDGPRIACVNHTESLPP